MENIERARKPEVVLLSHTPDPERIVATAMRQSRFKGGVVGVKLTRDDIKRLIELALNLKHFSVFEHVNFTFAIEGISRSCSHQFVRHRFFSFTQQSQRYVKEHGFPFVIPLTIQSEERALSLFLKLMEDIDDAYKELSQLVPVEDARFVLPNATETKIVATANARELMHFLKLRLAPVAQWEIRALAESMFNEVSKVAPNIFKENNIKFFE
ncbi:MAG: thymidylate synthase (FAD) [Caldiserica bacterium CG02_land_8_20_14_3_00_36_38]|jgi:thymidylate synthase (FAD)|nr:FAD-dependent thymidylate synthase [Caldisericota bacterium]OIP12189.1 MAG: thymidylate synthase, flavin-dependent [Caldisericum sp. CG2_30_36_11]PIP49988.1 MAG: thymidylate synthase (FAD) [Caldiserica bacterium CG23_combo_of_CG06-09_8_20_14_all_35_60]PIV56288.1 MAG: thymidylate synthase (FAD) [Caldiserica bacterium CG02_land_8_20_14_3_00_36_38]PIW10785.1 MAG: thymidylate synthase (FAD) [Caldiserica bacterium CG17_big_fil_post_rev_8_21_14_2_50_35_7]